MTYGVPLGSSGSAQEHKSGHNRSAFEILRALNLSLISALGEWSERFIYNIQTHAGNHYPVSAPQDHCHTSVACRQKALDL